MPGNIRFGDFVQMVNSAIRFTKGRIEDEHAWGVLDKVDHAKASADLLELEAEMRTGDEETLLHSDTPTSRNIVALLKSVATHEHDAFAGTLESDRERELLGAIRDAFASFQVSRLMQGVPSGLKDILSGVLERRVAEGAKFVVIGNFKGAEPSAAGVAVAAAAVATAVAPVAPAASVAARIIFEGKAAYKTLNDAMKQAVQRGRPIGIVPAVMVNTVKDASRTAKKQAELQVLSPVFESFLTKVAGYISSNPTDVAPNATKAINVARQVLATTLMDEWEVRNMRSTFDPNDHGEKHKELIGRQEQEVRGIIQTSGILKAIPSVASLGIAWFAKAGSFYSEHPLLAPYYRAYQVMAGVRFTKENLEEGLGLVRAIVRSGAYEDFLRIEEYVKPLGRADFRPLSEIVGSIRSDSPRAFDMGKAEWDVYVRENRAKLAAFIIKPLAVGRDYGSEMGKVGTNMTDAEGLQIFPQIVDDFNEEMQKQRKISLSVATGVLERFDESRLSPGEGTSDRLFLSLAKAIREVAHLSDVARGIILTGSLAGLVDQLEETELYRKPVMIMRGGGVPQPEYTGIYFLPTPEAYETLGRYMDAEIKLLERFSTTRQNYGLGQLIELRPAIAEMQRISEEAVKKEGGKTGERLVKLPDRFGKILFDMVMAGKIGKKKPTITRMGADSGRGIVHFATGLTGMASWETEEESMAAVPYMEVSEVEAGNPITPMEWRDALMGVGGIPWNMPVTMPVRIGR